MEQQQRDFSLESQRYPPQSIEPCATNLGNCITPEPPMRENKVRTISINQAHRGYIVGVGCHTFAFETKESMLAKITEYINEPNLTEDKWFKNELF